MDFIIVCKILCILYEFILVEVCAGNSSSRNMCNDNRLRVIKMQHSSLIEIPKSSNTFGNFDEYKIKPGVDRLTFSCSSRKPVIWNLYPKSPFVPLKADFYTDVKIPGRLGRYICYTVTITLSNITDDVSGSYGCRVLDPPSHVSEVGFYLYGDRSVPEEKSLSSIAFTMQRQRLDGTRVQLLIVPCTQIFSNNSYITLVRKNDEGKRRNIRHTDGITYNALYLICLVKTQFLISIFYKKNGATIQCKIQEGLTERRTDLINIIPSPEALFEPPEANMTLQVTQGEFYTFTCRSTRATHISTDYIYSKIISTSYDDDEYYKSQAVLKIRIPSSQVHFGTNEVTVKVLCKTDDVIIYTWEYILDRLNQGPHRLIPSMSIKIELNTQNASLVCLTPSKWNVKASFVPCVTFNDCQMKSELLYKDPAYQLTNDAALYEREARFSFPKFYASSHVSGMVRCSGYQQDQMSIFFTYTDHYGKKSYGILNNKDSNLGSTAYFRVSVDKTEIYENEFVIANCTTPLMLVYSRPLWEFEFQNKLRDSIKEEYMQEGQDDASGNTLVVSARIKIPYLNVTGISCTNVQFVYISPFIWKNGIMTENADEIRIEKKLASAYIKVNRKPKEHDENSISTGTIVGTSFGILFAVTLIIAVVTYYRLRSYRRKNEKIRQDEIDQFKKGNSELIAPGSSDNPQYVAYDESFEINLEELDINYQCVLGSGQFGIVYKGTANPKTLPLTVAVKSMKPGGNGNYLRAMMVELKVMLYIKTHSNVVRVIGACTNNLIEHQLYIVLEFCTNGDLHTYVRKNAEGFLSFVVKGRLSADMFAQPKSEYVNRMTSLNLIKWSSQIANGMAHISKLNVIHGDLAARNVLLEENLVAKISDFGLAKKLYEYSNYTRKRAVPVPWRWLAVESLAFTEFSPASDVWSYGVTLWEIFSLGTLPYPGQEYNRNFIQMLKGGFRLPLPEYATYEIYNMVLECWRSLPSERPKFEELKVQFDAMIEQ